MSKQAKATAVPKRKRPINSVSVPAEVIINIILAIFCAVCIVPFIFVIIIAFSSEASIRVIGYSFVPQEWSLEAFQYVMKLGDQLWRSYANSFFITIVGTVASVFVCALYSYALFRRDFKYRTFFTFFSFFTMMFGGGLAPTYYVCKNLLGLNDNYWALIIPLLFNPFNVIIMRTFFQSSVPEELIESAAIDGSGEYNTLFKIVTPISKPGIATIALLNALAYWNEWFIPMLYIRSAKYMPIQQLLMKMQKNADFLAKNAHLLGAEAAKASVKLPTQSLQMALVVMIVVPITFAYPFFQRYIVAGLTVGSVKG